MARKRELFRLDYKDAVSANAAAAITEMSLVKLTAENVDNGVDAQLSDAVGERVEGFSKEAHEIGDCFQVVRDGTFKSLVSGGAVLFGAELKSDGTGGVTGAAVAIGQYRVGRAMHGASDNEFVSYNFAQELREA